MICDGSQQSFLRPAAREHSYCDKQAKEGTGRIHGRDMIGDITFGLALFDPVAEECFHFNQAIADNFGNLFIMRREFQSSVDQKTAIAGAALDD